VRRLIVLGASNAVRGLPVLLRAARRAWGDPLEVMGALGVGRSYGMRSVVMGRALSGIAACGVWDELERRPRRDTTALVTDVGNDILYNAPVADLLGWVGSCLQRLRACGADVSVAGLPMDRLQRLTRPGYVLLRLALFPFHRWLGFREGLARARQVQEGLEQLAARHGARFVPARPEWYGADPVHFRWRARDAAWSALLGVEPAGGAAPADGPGALRLWTAAPERQWWLGHERGHPQPVLDLPSRGTLSLF
jgi:hypothetical protein